MTVADTCRCPPIPGRPSVTGRASGTRRGRDLATRILRRHARTHFHAESTLADIGIDSLAKLQLIVELQKRTGREVDPEVLDRLRTVGELRRWTHDLVEAAR